MAKGFSPYKSGSKAGAGKGGNNRQVVGTAGPKGTMASNKRTGC